MANGEWYYANGNEQQGPVALAAIQDMVRNGQIQPTTLVWRQGMPNWVSASQVPELFAPQAGAQAYPQPQGHAASPQYPPGGQYAPPGAAAGYPQQQQAGYPQQQAGYQQPGYYAPPQGYPQSVPNYLVQSILVTLFCCLPFGIVSIVYAAQVNGKLAAGDFAGAMDASQKAKTWSLWSFGIGLLFTLAYFALVVVGAMADVQ